MMDISHYHLDIYLAGCDALEHNQMGLSDGSLTFRFSFLVWLLLLIFYWTRSKPAIGGFSSWLKVEYKKGNAASNYVCPLFQEQYIHAKGKGLQ